MIKNPKTLVAQSGVALRFPPHSKKSTLASALPLD